MSTLRELLPAGPSRRDASPRLILVIVCAGVVLASLDLFIVNVALPQMGRDFHLRGGSLADLSWVLNGYAIVYAALLVPFGRLGRALSPRARFSARRGRIRRCVGGVRSGE
jgi:MFS family permease